MKAFGELCIVQIMELATFFGFKYRSGTFKGKEQACISCKNENKYKKMQYNL